MATTKTLTVLGTNAVPMTVTAQASTASKSIGKLDIIGNISSELINTFKAKLRVFCDPNHHMLCIQDGIPLNWLDDFDLTISLEPYEVRAGVDVEAAVVAAAFSAMFGADPSCEDLIFVGEIGLDGMFRPLSNVLAYARKGGKLVLPENSSEEVTLCGIPAYLINSIYDLQVILGIETGYAETKQFIRRPGKVSLKVPPPDCPDISEIKGQTLAKLALMIAATGRHNMLMEGPPGVGKSYLAKAIPGILPALTLKQALEVTSIWRMRSDVDTHGGIIGAAPFRVIDRNTSVVALKGGGHAQPLPGELSLAHHGVLYADELHQIKRSMLEELRTPLEDGVVHVSRAKWSVSMDCNVLFVASTNPCQCGYLTHPTIACSCTVAQVRRYKQRLSGPLLDRIPIVVHLDPITDAEYNQDSTAQTSQEVRTIIKAARKKAQARGFRCNDDIPPPQVVQLAKLTPEASEIEAELSTKISTRARDDMRRLALTVADLRDSELITAEILTSVAKLVRKDEL